MNDRLNFRAKSIDNNKFVYGYLCFIYIDNEKHCKIYSPDDAMSYDCYTETLGQCTGLKDRNGRLIYENDLVKLLVARNRGWIRKGTVAPVKWGNFTCCGFMLSCLGNLTEKCAKNCEVIGNVHENKELLNE